MYDFLDLESDGPNWTWPELFSGQITPFVVSSGPEGLKIIGCVTG